MAIIRLFASSRFVTAARLSSTWKPSDKTDFGVRAAQKRLEQKLESKKLAETTWFDGLDPQKARDYALHRAQIQRQFDDKYVEDLGDRQKIIGTVGNSQNTFQIKTNARDRINACVGNQRGRTDRGNSDIEKNDYAAWKTMKSGVVRSGHKTKEEKRTDFNFASLADKFFLGLTTIMVVFMVYLSLFQLLVMLLEKNAKRNKPRTLPVEVVNGSMSCIRDLEKTNESVGKRGNVATDDAEIATEIERALEVAARVVEQCEELIRRLKAEPEKFQNAKVDQNYVRLSDKYIKFADPNSKTTTGLEYRGGKIVAVENMKTMARIIMKHCGLKKEKPEKFDFNVLTKQVVVLKECESWMKKEVLGLW